MSQQRRIFRTYSINNKDALEYFLIVGEICTKRAQYVVKQYSIILLLYLGKNLRSNIKNGL